METILVILAFPAGAYLLAGLWFSISVSFEDLRRRRISLPGSIHLASGVHPVLFFILIAVWPAWYLPYRESVKKGKPQILAAYGEDQDDYFDDSKRIPETEPLLKPGIDALFSSSDEDRKLAELARRAKEAKDPNRVGGGN